MNWDITRQMPDSASIQTEWSGSTRASVAVVEAVAAATGRDPSELPSLQSAVDGDALNALFGSTDRTGTEVLVSFDYADTRVSVDSERGIVVWTDDEE